MRPFIVQKPLINGLYVWLLQKVLYNSVFPVLREQLDSPDMLVLILPSLLTMIEHSQDDDYKAIIQPEFKRVFSMSRPVQVRLPVGGGPRLSKRMARGPSH